MKKPGQFGWLFIALSICACEQTPADVADPHPLFELVPTQHTQVTFVNRLRESPSQNVLAYEYYYNGAGLAVGDLNGDQLPDLYFVSNLEPNALYLNQGNLQFKEVPQAGGAAGKRGFCTGVVMVDINRDGLLDIYVCQSGRFDNPELRRNALFVHQGLDQAGNPVFKEAAKDYGLDLSAYSSQASFFDYDKDGDLDMFLINHDIDTYSLSEISTRKTQQDGLSGVMLYRNDQDYFQDVTKAAGLENNRLGFGLGLAVGDLNQDHWPDVYVSHDYSGKDHLYINQQDGTFSEEIGGMTGHTSFYSMGNDIGDINNDGWQDIINLDMVAADNYGIKTSMSAMNPAQFDQLVAEGQHRQYMYNSLLLNNGSIHPDSLPYLSDVAMMCGVSSTDWSWAPLLFDFDNDGLKDLFITNGIKRNIRNNDAVKQVEKAKHMMATLSSPQQKAQLIQQMLNAFPYHRKPNRFFHNLGDISFEDIGPQLGMDTLPTASNGAVYADLDLDGDLDLVVNNVDQTAMIFQNYTQEQSPVHYIQCVATGPPSNPGGIGVEVSVYTPRGLQTASLYPSRGYLSSVEPMLHLGVGDVRILDSLIIRWPDGKTQRLTNVEANQRLTLEYAEADQHPNAIPQRPTPLFSSSTIFQDAAFLHQENVFDDYQRESLLPHKMSQMGPAVAVGDVNGDGLEDVFMGAAMGKESKLWMQQSSGAFTRDHNPLWRAEQRFEDVVAVWVDVEGDGDLDLIVGSGGNEATSGSAAYQLRVYANDGKGQFRRGADTNLPVRESLGVIKPCDWDGDGDQDLFVGGRQVPGAYPTPANSYLLENVSENGIVRFIDRTPDMAASLLACGMVTDAVWDDFDGDKQPDLLMVGEWMTPRLLRNKGNKFEDVTELAGLGDFSGWWFSLQAVDLDQDGDLDFVGGNVGLNYKYQTQIDQPFSIYARDFDQNGSLDIVLGYQEGSQAFPVRGRECSSNQMPFIKAKFPTYDAFGKATLTDIYGDNGLDSAIRYEATTFASMVFENNGNGSFSAYPLPRAAQVSSINGILARDIDQDGIIDLVVGGNLYGSEVETPRNDASIGLWLKGRLTNGTYSCVAVPAYTSGLQLRGEVRDLVPILWKGKSSILVSKNQHYLQLLTVNVDEATAILP